MPRKKLTRRKETGPKRPTLPRLKAPPLGTLEQYDLYLEAYDKFLAKVKELKSEFRKESGERKAAAKAARPSLPEKPREEEVSAEKSASDEAKKAAATARNRRRKERRKEQRLRKSIARMKLETEVSQAKTKMVGAKRSETAVKRLASKKAPSGTKQKNARERRKERRKPKQEAYKRKQEKRLGGLFAGMQKPVSGTVTAGTSTPLIEGLAGMSRRSTTREGSESQSVTSSQPIEEIKPVKPTNFGQQCWKCSTPIVMPQRGKLVVCYDCGAKNSRPS